MIFLDRKEECITKIIIEKDNYESIINNVHKLIEQKFHEKYGFEYCKKQYINIKRWNSIDDLNAVDYSVIAYFYMMNEFLLRSYSDCIYPKEYGNSLTDTDTEWNILLEISCSWRDWRDISITRTKNKESKNNVISNYIYKDLIEQRYKDILSFMLEHYTSKHRLCDLLFPYTEAHYRTYLIIEYEDGRTLLY